jgi:hypothetical protein
VAGVAEMVLIVVIMGILGASAIRNLTEWGGAVEIARKILITVRRSTRRRR